MNATASAASRTTQRFLRNTQPIFRFPEQPDPLDKLVRTANLRIFTANQIPEDFIPPSAIRPNAQHLKSHPQRELLLKNVLTLKDIHTLREPFSNKGVMCIGDTIPAAMRPSHPYPHCRYDTHQWIRDSVVGLEAMLNAGLYDKASKCIENLLTFLSLPAQRNRIIEYHFSSSVQGSPHDTYRKDHAKRAFIRIPISRKAQLADNLMSRGKESKIIEHGADWAHDQLGSFGQLIRLVCLAHKSEKINFAQIYERVIGNVAKKSPDSVEHLRRENILVSLQKFLYLVSIVRDVNGSPALSINTRGPWEEHPAKNRLSEMIPLLAGATEFLTAFERENDKILLAGDERHQRDFHKNLQIFCGLLAAEINRQIPDLPEAIARESFDIEALDSVVALLLSPRLIKLTPLQQFAIIRTILRNMGIVDESGILDAPGIIRYYGDTYCAENLHTSADQHWNVHKPNSFAYWTIFDPALAAHFFRRAHELAMMNDNKVNYRNLGMKYYEYGCKFLQRSCSQVMTQRYQGKINFAGTNKVFSYHYNPFDPVEAFFKNTTTGRYEPNPNVLTWTNAQRAEMFIWAELAGKIYGT